MYPDVLGTKYKKKGECKLASKKIYGHSNKYTQNEKVGKWFINYYYLTVKVKKNNGTYTVLMSNYVSDMKLDLEANLPF